MAYLAPSEVVLELPDWVFLGPSCYSEQIGIWICLIFVRDGIDRPMGFISLLSKKDWSLLALLLCQGHNEVPQCSLTILSYTLLIWAQYYGQQHSLCSFTSCKRVLHHSLNTYNAILLAEIIFNIERNGAQLAPKMNRYLKFWQFYNKFRTHVYKCLLIINGMKT
jgi:hypothetical protein